MAAAAVLVAAIVVLAIVFVQPSGDQAQPGPADTAKSGAAFARPDPCTLVTLDEMTQASGLPVAACVLTGLSPNRSPVPIKEGTAGRFTTTDPGQFGPPPNLETDDLGADPTSVFAQLCEAIRKGGQDLDSNAIAGLVPGLGDENCYVSTAVASLAVVTLAARRGNVAVIVTLGGNQRRDPPTDLVKLVLSRIR
jgi:hypothetical protein